VDDVPNDGHLCALQGTHRFTDGEGVKQGLSGMLVGTVTGIHVKTYSAKAESVERDWYVVDAAGKTLGRLATEVATRLRGKHKPEYTPHVDTGDYIVVLNAEKITVTGNKAKNKIYYSHTEYPGGIKDISFEKLLDKAPERVIQSAVKGMLPKGPLGREMFRKLKVYVGSEHPHTAQQPQTLEL
jgi:large subunit ribosomal protein L13